MRNKTLIVSLLMSLGAVACSHPPDASKLDVSVSSYCRGLELELHDAAMEHRKLAPAIDEKRLSEDQLERANGELGLTSIGNTPETRRARLRDFESRLGFCQRVRGMDAAQASRFEERLGALHEGLKQDVMSGAMPSAARTADLLDQMTALAHEVNGLPLQH